MNFFGFGAGAEIDIVLDGQETRKTAEIKTEDGKKERHPLYYDGETVSGKVNIQLKKPGSRLDHYGIKIELVGQIELYYDRGNHHDFLSLVKELARPGDLFQHTTYNFEFVNVEKPYECYTGSNVKLRYFLRVTIVRRLTDITKERELVVHTLSSYPEMNSSIKMEVGIEDCLHIEFEYNKSKYHLKDVIVGKIYFLLVRIKIKHMEIAIIKRETTGSGPNTFNENETIAKYEIMDGAPVRGESIPIRVFLAGYELMPTMKDVNKKFSVRYYLNLVLVDEEDRRYFKQQEIILWRKGDKTRKPFQASLQQQYKQMQNPNVNLALSNSSDHSNSIIKTSSLGIGIGVPEMKKQEHEHEIQNDKEKVPVPATGPGAGVRSESIDEISSEQITPDKEFQSVINSGGAGDGDSESSISTSRDKGQAQQNRKVRVDVEEDPGKEILSPPKSPEPEPTINNSNNANSTETKAEIEPEPETNLPSQTETTESTETVPKVVESSAESPEKAPEIDESHEETEEHEHEAQEPELQEPTNTNPSPKGKKSNKKKSKGSKVKVSEAI